MIEYNYVSNSECSVLIVAVLLNNFSTSWACLQPSRLQMVGLCIEYNDLYYYRNLQSNQLHIAAFKWLLKVHVAYGSRTMATDDNNGAPQQLRIHVYCQFHRL